MGRVRRGHRHVPCTSKTATGQPLPAPLLAASSLTHQKKLWFQWPPPAGRGGWVDGWMGGWAAGRQAVPAERWGRGVATAQAGVAGMRVMREASIDCRQRARPQQSRTARCRRQTGTSVQVECSLAPSCPGQARPPTVVADRGGNVCGHLGGADLGVQVLNAQTRQLRELAQRGVHVVHVRLQGAQGGVDGWQRQGRGRAWKGGRWFCGGARGVQPASIVGRGQMHASSALQLPWWCFVWWMVMVVVSTNGCKAGGATGLGGERGTEWRRPLAPAAGPCLHHPQSQPAGKP